MKSYKRYAKIGILGAMGVLILLLLTGCGEQKKNATEYISPVFSGLEGEGKITLTFDRDQLLEDITSKKKLTEREIEELDSVLSGIEKDYVISEKEGLSNGDSIEVTGGMDKDLLKKFGIIFDLDTASYQVEGLIGRIEVSLNDYIHMERDGFEGNGKVWLTLDRDSLVNRVVEQAQQIDPDISFYEVSNNLDDSMRSFTISPSYLEGLSTGDPITAALSVDEKELSAYGVTFLCDDYVSSVPELAPVETIALNDYLTVQWSGYDSFGQARVTLDQARLTNDLAEQFEAQGRSAYGWASEWTDFEGDAASVAERVKSSWNNLFVTTLSAETDLSNGDAVTVTSIPDPEREDLTSADAFTNLDYGYILEKGEFSTEVEGLPASASIDLQNYIHLEYQGFDGQGSATLVYEDDAFQDAMNALVVSQMPDLGSDYYYRNAWSLLHGASADLTGLENLSNGDPVELAFTNETSSIPDYGIYVTASAISDEVQGLVPQLTISLEDYLEPVFTGYDGAGHLEAQLKDSLYDDVRAQLEERNRGAFDFLSENSDLEYETNRILDRINDAWRYDLELNLSKVEKISNDDSITVSLLPSEDAADQYGVTVLDNTVRIDDAGLYLVGFESEISAGELAPLPAPQEIDLSKAVTVTFSGICPYVTVNREIDDTLPYLDATGLYDISGSETIHAENGDPYQITITHDDEALLEMGYVVTEDTLSTEVAGLETWTLGITDLDDAALTSLQSVADAMAEEQILANADNISSALTQDEGWTLWEGMIRPGGETICYGEGTEDSSNYNMLGFLGRFELPVKGLDHQASYQNVYYVSWINDVRRDLQGNLNSENGLRLELYYDEAEAREALETKINESLGEGAVITELTADAAAYESLDYSDAPVYVAAPEENQIVLSAAEVTAFAKADQAVAGPVAADGHLYYRFDTIDGKTLSWQKAKAFCEKAGGHLATITSGKEVRIIQYLMRENAQSEYWLGATDEEREGRWKWVTEESFDFKNWDGPQPDNDSGNDEESENYMAAYPNGTWNDLPGGEDGIGFLLEIEPETAMDSRCQALWEMTPSLTTNTFLWDWLQDPYENLYFCSLGFDAGNRGMCTFDLNGTYTTLSFTVSTTEDVDNDAVMEMAIWGDDTLLYTLYNYRRATAPQAVQLDVTGVRKLSIETRTRKGSGVIALNDAYLLPVEKTSQETNENRTFLEIPVLVESGADWYLDRGLPTDAAGRIYRDTVVLDSAYPTEIILRADVDDERLVGVLAMDAKDLSPKTRVKVEFLADDNVVESYWLSAFEGAAEVDIPLEQVSLVTVRISKENEEDPGQFVIFGNVSLVE